MGRKQTLGRHSYPWGYLLVPCVTLLFLPYIEGLSLRDRQCQVNACNFTHSDLQCPRGQMILLTNVTCQSSRHAPCPGQLYLDVLNKCSGRQRCSLRLLALQKLQKVCLKAPAVSVVFTCIQKPSDDAHDEACTGANRLTDSRGFVYSPGYPKRYSKTPCWWKLFLDRGQDVQFTIFEMQSFFTGSPRDTPDFLRVSPSVPAPSCPFKQRDVVSFQVFRGDLLTVKQFRVRCHMEAEITLRQLSGAGKGVRLLLFYQVIPSEKEVSDILPGFLTRPCTVPKSHEKLPGYFVPQKNPLRTQLAPFTTTTVTVTMPTGMSSPEPSAGVDVVEHYDNYIGLLIGLVVGGLLSVCLVIGVAVLCLRRRRSKAGADYNSFSEGKTGSTTACSVDSGKGQKEQKSSTNPNRDISSGYVTESDSSEGYDEPNNPTYESIEKYRLNDTYSRVADEISSPPPAPKPRDERENLDSVSATYAEIQSILDERIPPEVPLSYREFLRRQLLALDKDVAKGTCNNSGPYAVSGYLCGGQEKAPSPPPKVPPKNPAGVVRKERDSVSPARDSNNSRVDKARGEPVYASPTQREERKDSDVIFVENDLYQPFEAT
ncbi:uncharacterized protein LOC135477622 isoform X2 [Liolophura sinensis]|uniref:uncharacterized protein LOC135477622 isoform X2 n=1 Tax=Liolophura sinensis TaxID=3198878 RepID=UPI00315880CF